MKEGDKKRLSSSVKQQKPALNTGRRTANQATTPLRSTPSRKKRESSASTVVKANEVVESVSSFEEDTQMEEQIAETVSSQGESMSADDEKSRPVSRVNRADEISYGNMCDLESNDADGDGEDEGGLEIRVEVLENRLGKLEEELRQVAALEISLYSVTPEHGSSSHKVHTPARRLSRLYFHACKHWSQHRRGSVAKSIASGIVLIAKSCGNDVPRLTFWLSNAVVLRDVISEALGCSPKPRNTGSFKQNGVKQNNGETLFIEDWQETGTFTAALEKVESWIFSRIVESVWWQSLTPHMQPPAKNSPSKNSGKSLGQANFSINLWNSAFQDAAQRLCPVRGAGHECGCSPLIAKMVMESCVARLDVAMFNAILRESANETPTDPVSDPIIDSRVLPIPAGNLSFGSGAQLKNSIGNWSRWLSDIFEADEHNDDDDARDDHKYFRLLSDLSDLLMLPKDMLMDRRVRQEVCPFIGLSLIKRILCNFTPDEFCPDFVPGAVLESLNAERQANDSETFPYAAAPVLYAPRSQAGTGGIKRFLCRNASNLQRKGYTSDEELEELSCPLTSIIDSAPPLSKNENSLDRNTGTRSSTIRYELLRQVWSE